MLFNSIAFAFFLPAVFILYWVVVPQSIRARNILLLTASYFFYAAGNWKFLFLLAFSTLLDFYTGQKIEASEKNKKLWLWLSISVNLGLLGVFKYYNFFVDNFTSALALFGLRAHPWTLQVILPVGISFYTFHGLSYIIDIYHKKITAEKNLVNYSLFVSFFPLLVAGPIERATHLLPQLKTEKFFNYDRAADGLRQILWGLFKKIVIADHCAEYADQVFNNPGPHSGSTAFIGAFFFAFQIYGDFSGYSDIALGTARLFGIELLRNFSFPYFSRSIAEFWKRWHMSLSGWFRDYLYIPLGGNKGSLWLKTRNVFIVFLVSGFWHGASWTFIVWGLLNALFMLPTLLYKSPSNFTDTVSNGRSFPTLSEFVFMTTTFALTVFAWIFFRSADLQQARHFVSAIFSPSLFTAPGLQFDSTLVATVLLLCLFLLVEWNGREQKYAIESLGINLPKAARYSFYYLLACIILLFNGSNHQFIYFQF